MVNNKQQKKQKKPEEWGKDYESKRHTYEAFNLKIVNLLEDLLKENNLNYLDIESRCKTTKSFIEKIERKGGKYKNPIEEITDLLGTRIIIYYLEDVVKIGDLLKTEFDVDLENSIDKLELLDPDRFGYQSVQYVVSLSSSRKNLKEWRAFSGFKFEIQVRTVLQHAWAAIDHELRYKSTTEIPKQVQRKLFRLSALLELGDEEFSDLRKSILKIEREYEKEFKKGKLGVEINANSLAAYLRKNRQRQAWNKIARESGFETLSVLSSPMRRKLLFDARSTLLKTLTLTDVKTISELDVILNESIKWRKSLLKTYIKLRIKTLHPYATSYGAILFVVIYAKREKIDDKILDEIGLPIEAKIILKKIIKEGKI